jgi:outer membrane protein assembly factor BamB
MKRLVSGIMLTLLLTSMLTLAFNIQPGKASGTIYIRPDGSTDSPTASIRPDTGFHTLDSVDWWPMFHHDLSHTGYSTSTAPNTNNTVWNYTTGNLVVSSPAVADGKVYVGSLDNKTYCFDASTGAYVWSYTTGNWVHSSPAVADGKVYVGSNDNRIYCLDALTGAYNWSYTISDFAFSSPAVADGKVYVGSQGGRVYCLDALTGAHIWNYTTGGSTFSSPAVADGKVYVGSNDFRVYCLDALTGASVWNYTTGYYVYSSPAVAGGKVYVGSGDNKVYCLDALTGAHIWNYTTGNVVYSSPAVADGKVFVGSMDYNVYCLDALTGAHIWNYTTGNVVYSSPAVAGGRVYVGSFDNKVYCLDALAGASVWNYTTGYYVYSSPAVAGGRVYVGSYDCKVYAFGPVPDVAVTSVVCSKTVVGQGYSMSVNVTVENQGNSTETFNVTAYYSNATATVTPEQWDIFWSMGDVNRDGYINQTDIDIIIANYLWHGPPGGNPADINSDGTVDQRDMNICVGNQGLDIWTYFSIFLVIGVQEIVNLSPGESASVIFVWDTTGVPKAKHTVKAVADFLIGETDTDDNTYLDGWVKVTIPGDVTEDERIWADMQDISMMIDGFMAKPGADGKYWHSNPCDYCPHSPNCDINNDLSIDMADIQLAIDNFMQP